MPSPLEDYIAYIRRIAGNLLSGIASDAPPDSPDTERQESTRNARTSRNSAPTRNTETTRSPISRRNPARNATPSSPVAPHNPAPIDAPELATPQQNLAHHPDIIAALRKELEKKHPQAHTELQKKLARNKRLPATTMADIHVILMSKPEVFVQMPNGTYQNRDAPRKIERTAAVKRDISASRRAFLENEKRRTDARQRSMRNLRSEREVHAYRLLVDYRRNIVDELSGEPLRSLTPKLRAEIEAFWADRSDPAAAYPCGETVSFLRLYPPDDAPLQRFASLELDLEESPNLEEPCEDPELSTVQSGLVPASKMSSTAAESNANIIKTMREASAIEMALCYCEGLRAFQQATRTEKISLLLQVAGEPIPFADLAKAAMHHNIGEKMLRKMLNGNPEWFVATPQDTWTTPFALALFVRRTGADLPLPGERDPEDDEVWGFDKWR